MPQSCIWFASLEGRASDLVTHVYGTGLVINSASSMLGLVLHGDLLGAHVSGSLKLKMSVCLPAGLELSHRQHLCSSSRTPACPVINASP